MAKAQMRPMMAARGWVWGAWGFFLFMKKVPICKLIRIINHAKKSVERVRMNVDFARDLGLNPGT